MAPREARKDLRKSVLKAASAVFIEKGYRGATTREITERAGVSRGLLYFYFKTKEDLFTELARQYVRRFEKKIEGIYQRISDDDPVHALRTYIDITCRELTKKKKVHFYRFLKTYGIKVAKRYAAAFNQKQSQILAGILRVGEQKGVFTFGDVEETAILILSFLRGIYAAHEDGSLKFKLVDPATVFNMIFSGIRKPESSQADALQAPRAVAPRVVAPPPKRVPPPEARP
jgi:AcrR family transcriptional regulator